MTASLAQMVADPCSGPLVPGLYGSASGMLARLKRSEALSSHVHGSSSGYVLWDPDFSNQKNVVFPKAKGNLVVWLSDDPSQNPVNTTAEPYGNGNHNAPEPSNTAEFLADPAANLLESDIVSDARPLAACLQLTYTGTLLNAAGEICFITNLPAASVLNGGTGNVPLNVNDLFAYAPHKERFSPETHEVKFRPGDASKFYRNEEDALFSFPVASGAATGPTAVTEVAEGFVPKVIGFAWRGLTPGSSLTYDVIKNIEWRAETGSGLGQMTEMHSGPSQAPVVNAYLDSHPKHNWFGRIGHAMSTGFGIANQMASLALSAAPSLGNYAMGAAAEALPALEYIAPLLI